MRTLLALLRGVLRALGLVLVVLGSLALAAALAYWLMGGRFGSVVALWAAAWTLPFIGVGCALTWLERRAAGFVAIACGLLGLLLLLVSGTLMMWIPAVAAGAAVVLGLGVTVVAGLRAPPPPPTEPGSGEPPRTNSS